MGKDLSLWAFLAPVWHPGCFSGFFEFFSEVFIIFARFFNNHQSADVDVG